MANSFTFNSIDLSAYELVVTTSRAHILRQLISYSQVKDRAYSSSPIREPRTITLDIAVTGSDHDDLNDNLDAIKRTITTEIAYSLILDIINDRYFNAQLQSFDGAYSGPTLFTGTIEFICVDPNGSDNTETNNDYNINSDPKDIDEITGGTGLISPVFTLTAGENLVAATIKVKNVSTDEELTWAGDIDNGEKLAIDVDRWIVELEGVASMSGVTGKFPHLYAGQINLIRITGFGSLGSLNITYRNRFL